MGVLAAAATMATKPNAANASGGRWKSCAKARPSVLPIKNSGVMLPPLYLGLTVAGATLWPAFIADFVRAYSLGIVF